MCNNGGLPFPPVGSGQAMVPTGGMPADGSYSGGRIELIDPVSGACAVLYENGGESMAIKASGNLFVATLDRGVISAISPEGALLEEHASPDRYVTSICFRGADLRTACVTLSSSGRLVSCRRPRPGLVLKH